MPDFKQIAKNGWNSEKTGVIRNKVDAALGRESSHRDVSNYSATPLDQLRDPSTFAPPPKRLNSGVLPPPQLPPASSSTTASPTSPAGGAHAHAQYGGGHAQQQGLLPDAAAPPPAPPRPYRVDTTGLSTAHLPLPPGRRDAADGSRSSSPPPPPYSVTATPGSRPAPPSLPPRLPPRANSASPAASSPAPDLPGRQPGYLNQGAVDRLGGAGVSVPGLGIGGSGGGDRPVLPPPPPSRSSAASPSSLSRPDASPTASGGSMSEMRSRFSKFKDGLGGTTSPSPSPAPAQSSQGTTWTQKQAALKTMSDFKKDPKSVSYSSVRSAASTANNFRERHGEQVAAGVTKAKGMNEKYGVSEKAKGMNEKYGVSEKAKGMNEKYGVSEKVGGYMGRGNGGSSAETGRVASPAQSHLNSMSTAVGGLMGKKKPPPPPPKKKPGLGGSSSTGGGGEDAPPPVPLSTRPV